MNARHLSPHVSFVIVGKDQASHLVKCVDAIKLIHSIDGTVEIIYIDMGSKDESVSEARRRDVHVIELSLDVTLATAHNIGWRTSRGDYIFFMDSLGILNSQFTLNALQMMKDDPTIGVICGRHGPTCICCSKAGYVECCEQEALIRRTSLDEVHGFDKTLLAGDLPDACRRIRALGYKTIKMTDPLLDQTKEGFYLREFWNKSLHQGVAYAQVSQRYASSSDRMWTKEANRNLWEGGCLVVGIPLFLIISLILSSWYPLVLGLALLAGLVIATFLRADIPDWNPYQRARHALKTVAAQLPIFFGQLYYRLF